MGNILKENFCGFLARRSSAKKSCFCSRIRTDHKLSDYKLSFLYDSGLQTTAREAILSIMKDDIFTKHLLIL